MLKNRLHAIEPCRGSVHFRSYLNNLHEQNVPSHLLWPPLHCRYSETTATPSIHNVHSLQPTESSFVHFHSWPSASVFEGHCLPLCDPTDPTWIIGCFSIGQYHWYLTRLIQGQIPSPAARLPIVGTEGRSLPPPRLHCNGRWLFWHIVHCSYATIESHNG